MLADKEGEEVVGKRKDGEDGFLKYWWRRECVNTDLVNLAKVSLCHSSANRTKTPMTLAWANHHSCE